MLRVHALLVEQLDDELRLEQQLPLSSYDVLVNLARTPRGQLRMRELADQILMTKSGLTRIVDVLERQGLVERIPAEEDGRGLCAKLTPQGREKFHAAHRVHLRGIRSRFLDKLTTSQLAPLVDAWHAIMPELFPHDG